MTPSRFSSRWMCAHSGRTRSCTGAARGNNRASSAAVPRGSSSSAASVPASLRPPLGKAKRAAVRLPTSVHDPRSRCSTSSGIDVPLPGIRVPLPGIDVPLPPKSMFPLRPESAFHFVRNTHGAGVKAVSPAERGRSAATRLDAGEHTQKLLV